MPVTSAVFSGVHVLDVLGDGLEANGVLLDEFVVEPIVLDHQMQNAVKQCDVAAGLDGQK